MRKIPEYLLGTLSFCYSMQEYGVRWSNAFSSYLVISNSIRQGGILPSMLYNLGISNDDKDDVYQLTMMTTFEQWLVVACVYL